MSTSSTDSANRQTAFSIAHAVLASQLCLDNVDRLPPFDLAVQYAVHQFVQTLAPRPTDESGNAGKHVSEETATASLIGFLSSTLNWMGFLERISGIEASLPSMSWGYQSKKQESCSGGDFGLVVDVDDDLVALAFFQAKNLDAAENLNINRTPVSYRNGCSDQRQTAEQQVRDILRTGIWSGQLTPESHQFAKLTATRDKGRSHGVNNGTSWVHYVGWSINGAAPITISLDHAIEFMRSRWCDGELAAPQFGETGWSGANIPMKSVSRQAQDFGKMLSRDHINTSNDWLRVSADAASMLVGELKILGGTWHLFGTRSGGSSMLAQSLKADQDSAITEQSLLGDALPEMHEDLQLRQIMEHAPASPPSPRMG